MRAYAIYLQGNDVPRSYGQPPQARALYQECLELDPDFAPAWAQLGRCERVISKFIDGAAEGPTRAHPALRRALELNPRLSVAHKYLAQLEAESSRPGSTSCWPGSMVASRP